MFCTITVAGELYTMVSDEFPAIDCTEAVLILIGDWLLPPHVLLTSIQPLGTKVVNSNQT